MEHIYAKTELYRGNPGHEIGRLIYLYIHNVANCDASSCVRQTTSIVLLCISIKKWGLGMPVQEAQPKLVSALELAACPHKTGEQVAQQVI